MTIYKFYKLYPNQVLIFFIAVIFYISITAGNFWEADSQAVYETTKSMIDRFKFDMPCYFATKSFNGSCYTQYGLFMSVAVSPFYLVEKLFRDGLHNQFFPQYFFSSFTNPLMTAMLVTLFYQFLIKLKFSKKISLLGVFLYGLCTFLPVYTKSLYAEPLLTLLLFSSFYILFFKKVSNKNLSVVGLIFGLAFLTKLSVMIFTPCLIFIFWKRRVSFKKILVFLLPLLFCFLIFFIYNNYRFGNIFDTGYRNEKLNYPFLSGLYFHLLSPGKSIFLYQPFLLFAFFGFKSFYKKRKLIFITLALMAFINLIFYSLYRDPPAGLAWGSRYFYTLLPFLILGALYCYQNIRQQYKKIIFYLLALLALVIQISAMYISYHRYYSYLFIKNKTYNLQVSYDDPRSSPLYGQWKMIFRINYDNKDRDAWREAFQEYIEPFNLNYKIAPPDLFFARSRSLLPYMFILFLMEIYLVRKLLEKNMKNN